MGRLAALLAGGMALASVGSAEDLGYWTETRVLAPVLVRESADRRGTQPLVIALHGRGGNASEFASVWEAFAEPRPLLAAPQGPYPILIDGKKPSFGWSWFVLSRDRELWRRADPFAVEHVLGVIRDLKREREIDQVYLLGFSQGVALAYMTALQAPEQVSGVIAFAGQIPTDTVAEESFRRAAGSVRVFIAHGEADRVIKPKESERARKHLESLGYSVVYHTFPGAHQLSAELLRTAQRWMDEGKNRSTHGPRPTPAP